MFKTILLPIELGEESSWRRALPAALLHARDDGASLTLLTVTPDFGEGIVGAYFPADYAEKAMQQVASEMAAFRAAQVPSEVTSNALVRSGSIYHEIIKAADEIGADLIVMASHRPEFRDYLIGPNADRVVRHAKQSVLVVRE